MSGIRTQYARIGRIDPVQLVFRRTELTQQLGADRYRQMWDSWTDLRRDGLTSLLRELNRWRHNLGMPLAIGVVLPLPVEHAQNRYFQDFQQWQQEDLTDYFIALGYDASPDTITGMLAQLSQSGSTQVYCALPWYRWQEPYKDTLVPWLKAISAGGGTGVFGFGYQDFVRICSDPQLRLDDLLQTSGIGDSTSSQSQQKIKTTLEVRALYGFKADRPPFQGMSTPEIPQRLIQAGFNGVFGGSGDSALREALKAHGVYVFEEVPFFVGQQQWQKYPGAQPLDSRGQPLPRQEWYHPVCPCQEQLIEEKIEYIRTELLLKRKVDGVWLDFIRWPCFWEQGPCEPLNTSFSDACIEQFIRDERLSFPSGVDTQSRRAVWILTNAREQWRDWRVRKITRIVSQVRRMIDTTKPDTLLGAFVIPWREDEYLQAILTVVGQDYRALSQHLDIISPMLYFHQLGRNPEWVHEFVQYTATMVPIRVWPIVQAYSLPTQLPEAELMRAVELAQQPPATGMILFSQDHVDRERRWHTIAEAFRRAAQQ